MLQVLLFISLKRVERYFRGQLAAWKTKPGWFSLQVFFFFFDFIQLEPWLIAPKSVGRFLRKSEQVLHCRSITGETHVCASRAELYLKGSYWTGSSPALIDQLVRGPRIHRRGKTFLRSAKCGFAVNTLQPNEPSTKNNKSVAHCERGWRVITPRRVAQRCFSFFLRPQIQLNKLQPSNLKNNNKVR